MCIQKREKTYDFVYAFLKIIILITLLIIKLIIQLIILNNKFHLSEMGTK